MQRRARRGQAMGSDRGRNRFNFPGANRAPQAATDVAQLPGLTPMTDDANADIITGTVNEEKSEAKPKGEGSGPAAKEEKPATPGKDNKPAAAGKAEPAPAPPNGKVILPENKPLPSPAERALLERLSERRQELDKRARELDIREGLIGEAEKRIDAHLAEIKQGEAQLATAAEKKDEADAARFKGLVTMYEDMKAPRCGQDFRPPGNGCAVGSRRANQAAANGGDLGADVSRRGRAIDRRTCKPGQSSGEAGRRTAEDRRPADAVKLLHASWFQRLA